MRSRAPGPERDWPTGPRVVGGTRGWVRPRGGFLVFEDERDGRVVTIDPDYRFVHGLAQLDDLLRRSAARSPTAPLLVLPGGVGDVTYAEAEACTERFARELRAAGLAPGDRVALLAENGVAFIAAFYGAMRAGGIAVPVNTSADASGLAHVLRDSGARALVLTERFRGVAEAVFLGPDGPDSLAWVFAPRPLATGRATHRLWNPEGHDRANAEAKAEPTAATGDPTAAGVAPGSDPTAATGDPTAVGVASAGDRPAAIIYTSGSTGAPRGAVLTHRNLLANTASILSYLRLGADERMLAVLPFYYVYGLSLLNTHVAVGAALLVGTELFFPNRVVDRMHADGATGFAGVPSSFNVLLHRSRLREDVPPSLRYVTQAGGAMAPELTRELLAALPGVRIFIMYGATEASARLSWLPPERLAEKIGSIGVAIPGVTLRVLREDGTEAEVDEPGELVAQGENVMVGYWNAPEETAAVLGPEGLRTGDLARRDADGYFYIVGRKKEMIKSGAHRISPKEIEERLVEHPAVLEAAVVGVPDDLLGEAIVAFVVLHEGDGAAAAPDPAGAADSGGAADPGGPAHPAGGAIDERALQRFLLDRVAEYKVPRRVLFCATLPKNESGKVQKRALRDLL